MIELHPEIPRKRGQPQFAALPSDAFLQANARHNLCLYLKKSCRTPLRGGASGAKEFYCNRNP
jgi:hypothetical protein